MGFVHIDILCGQATRIKIAPDTYWPVATDSLPLDILGKYPGNGIPPGCFITVCNPPQPISCHPTGDPDMLRQDDWGSLGQRFYDHVAIIFVMRREGNQISFGIVVPLLLAVYGSFPYDTGITFSCGFQGFHILRVALSYDSQSPRDRIESVQNLEKEVQPLLWIDPAEKKDVEFI